MKKDCSYCILVHVTGNVDFWIQPNNQRLWLLKVLKHFILKLFLLPLVLYFDTAMFFFNDSVLLVFVFYVCQIKFYIFQTN